MVEKLKKLLKHEKIQSLKQRSPLFIKGGTPIKEVIAQMQERKRGCAIIMKGKKLVGIFTERDLLNRVLDRGLKLTTPIDEVMTLNPIYLKTTSSIANIVKIMSQKGYRHIILVDEKENIQGFVSVRDVIDYLAEHFPYEIYNLPPDPHQISTSPEGA